MRNFEQRKQFHAEAFWRCAVACWIVLYLPAHSRAQTPYLLKPGAPTFTSADPFELGYVNLANGVVHVEIPLAASPQRGGPGFTFKLVYDSNIWHIVNTGSALVWQPNNVPSDYQYGGWQGGGWRFVASSTSPPGFSTRATNCGGSNWYWVYSNFYWAEPNGTQHYFPGQTLQDGGCGQTNTSSFDSYAQDSSGYHVFVTNYHTAKVYAKDGTIVADATQSTYLEKDVNGNFFTTAYDSNYNPIWVDTLGRSLVTRTTDSQNPNKDYYAILNSQGTTSTYSVTWEMIVPTTSFGVAGVTECVGNYGFWAIQTIGLPDGTSYSFTYESVNGSPTYGLLTNVALPSGGSVSATYANFMDSYQNIYRWVSTRTSGSGTWTYTPAVISYCSTGGTGCKQKVTVTTPAGDDAVHTFTHNNGAWNTETDSYTGSSTSGGTLLKTLTTDYDFSQPCPANSTCTTGAAYVRPYRNTTINPAPGGNISRKTELSYDSPQYGNVIETREWKYYTGTPPSTADRITDTAYVTAPAYINAQMISLPYDVLVKDGAGNKLAETAIGYDSTSLTSKTGITHHDDLNFGTSYYTRGNPTVIQKWVSGTTYLTQTNYYDTTGQKIQTTDPYGTNTTYSYADNFATDNGSSPPPTYTPGTPTNAYLTQVNLPVSGTKKFGYYFGSGKQAFVTDQNNNSTYSHFIDPFDRLTSSYWPGGGSQTKSYSTSGHTHYTSLGGQIRQDVHTEDGFARIT